MPKKKRKPRWYCVATTPRMTTVVDKATGKSTTKFTHPDDAVKKEIWKKAKIEDLSHLIRHILIFKKKEVRMKKGRRVEEMRKCFQGYLFVRCIFTDDLFHLITKIRGVMAILPQLPPITGVTYIGKMGAVMRKPTKQQLKDKENWRPTAIPNKVMNGLIDKMRRGKESRAKPVELSFGIGDRVEIIEGTFKGLEGKVSQINGEPEAPTVRVMTELMGRSVPVELDWRQVEVDHG